MESEICQMLMSVLVLERRGLLPLLVVLLSLSLIINQSTVVSQYILQALRSDL